MNLTSYVYAYGRRQWVVRLLVIVALVAIVGIISDFLELNLLNRIINEEQVTFSEIDSNDDRQGIVGIIFLIVIIPTFILYFLWFHQVYRNLSVMTSYGTMHSPKWTFWGFVIPIMNLYRPYHIMREIWRGTSSNPTDDTVPTIPLIKWWWGMWLLSTSVDRVVFRTFLRAETAQELRTSTWFSILSSLTFMIAAILAIQVVQLITEQQEMRYQQLVSESTTDD